MNKDNLGSLPEDIQPFLIHLVNGLHDMLANEEFIQPVWFMIDRRGERMMPIVAPFEDEEDKQDAAQFVRHLVLAQQPHVDAVVFMCEAWKKTLAKGDRDFRTPVRDRPGREDIIVITVETYDGTWTADPVVTGQPGEPRSLATVQFHYQPDCAGAMTGYLPPRNKQEIN